MFAFFFKYSKVSRTFGDSMSILGYYYANERTNDKLTPLYINTISDAIKTTYGSCIILQLDNEKIADLESLCVIVSKSIFFF